MIYQSRGSRDDTSHISGITDASCCLLEASTHSKVQKSLGRVRCNLEGAGTAGRDVDNKQRNKGERRISAEDYYFPESMNRRHGQSNRREGMKLQWSGYCYE
jgi:hypothetical protein